MLIRPWEKLVLGQKYNEVLLLAPFLSRFPRDLIIYRPLPLFSQLGAVRFDRDLRAITTYLSSQTAFGDVREKFVRLQQIATLLNLDQVRVFLFYVRECVLMMVHLWRARKMTWTNFTMVLGLRGS